MHGFQCNSTYCQHSGKYCSPRLHLWWQYFPHVDNMSCHTGSHATIIYNLTFTQKFVILILKAYVIFDWKFTSNQHNAYDLKNQDNGVNKWHLKVIFQIRFYLYCHAHYTRIFKCKDTDLNKNKKRQSYFC